MQLKSVKSNEPGSYRPLEFSPAAFGVPIRFADPDTSKG